MPPAPSAETISYGPSRAPRTKDKEELDCIDQARISLGKTDALDWVPEEFSHIRRLRAYARYHGDHSEGTDSTGGKTEAKLVGACKQAQVRSAE
jgi:hypothetical protein